MDLDEPNQALRCFNGVVQSQKCAESGRSMFEENQKPDRHMNSIAILIMNRAAVAAVLLCLVLCAVFCLVIGEIASMA